MIAGTNGYIVVEPPWWKTTHFEIHYEDPNLIEKYDEKFLGDGLRYELSDMVARLRGTDAANFKLKDTESVAIAEVMEKFRER